VPVFIVFWLFLSMKKPRKALSRAEGQNSPSDTGTDQPPFSGRLPGFFLLRVDVLRSRLTFWPYGANALFEVVSLYRGNM